jgi:hypothetical protein
MPDHSNFKISAYWNLDENLNELAKCKKWLLFGAWFFIIWYHYLLVAALIEKSK